MDNKENVILYVDDEKDNLTAFKAVFRRDFTILCANSGQEAMEILENNSIDLVITDQRMPEITGVDLLEKVRTQYPDIIRMVLTGYSDMLAIVDAINKGQVYHYITKPWNVDELKVIMSNALEAHSLKKQNRLLKEEKDALLLRTTQMEKENILSQYEILKNQINPHFLFNSINILASLIQVDKDKAIKFTHEFSKLYRNLLELREQLLITLEEELDFAESYTYLQRMRFDDALVINIEISDTQKNKSVPPFTLQLLIENAIKHNVVSIDNPLIIKIFSQEDNLIVENNLQLRGTKPESTQIGLNNLKARYSMITDDELTFTESHDKYVATLPLI